MRLYGNDMDETTTVVEADLGWIVGWKKDDVPRRPTCCSAQKADGAPRKLVGFEMLERAIARHGYDVYVDGQKAGVVTSGTQTPFLKKAIGMAYLPSDRTAAGTEFEIDIRGRRAKARRRPDAVLQAPEVGRVSDPPGAHMYPSDLKYTKDHEWVQIDGADARRSASPTTRRSSSATSSISSCRRSAARLKKGEVFGTIESVKAVSELYCPGRRRSHRGATARWPQHPEDGQHERRTTRG